MSQFQQITESSSCCLDCLEEFEEGTELYHSSSLLEQCASLEKEIPSRLCADIYLHKGECSHCHCGSCATERYNYFRNNSWIRREHLSDIQKSKDCNLNTIVLCSACENEVTALRGALQAERELVHVLCIELDKERDASGIAADEAMNMIERLQEEKAAMQMESRQFKRMAEERDAHDKEAIALLKDILMQKEDNIAALENEVESYRQVLERIDLEGLGSDACQRRFLERGANEGKEEHLSFPQGFNNSWMGSCLGTTKTTSTSAVKCSDRSHEVVYQNSEMIDQRCRKCIRSSVSDCVQCVLNKFENGGRSLSDVSCRSFIGNATFDWEQQLSELHGSDVSERVAGSPWKRSCSTGEDDSCRNWREMESEGISGAVSNYGMFHELRHSELKSGAVRIATDVRPPEQKEIEPQASLAASTKAMDWSVWDRIRRLEERLQHLGEQQEYEKNCLSMYKSNLQDGWCTEEDSCVMGLGSVVSTQWNPADNGIFEQRLSFIDNAMCSLGVSYANEGEGRFDKNQFTDKLEASVSYKTAGAETTERDWSTLQKKYNQEISCRSEVKSEASPSTEVEESWNHGKGDGVEGVHDVYEVQYDSNRFGRLASEQGVGEWGDGIGKLELSLGPTPWEVTYDYSENESKETISNRATKQLPVNLEAGSSRIGKRQSLLPLRNSWSADSDTNSDQTSFNLKDDTCGEEEQQLILRVQALKAESDFMKQAIVSLIKENGELKLLHEISQQLLDLKGTVGRLDQPMGSLQQEEPSFLPFFKGILSFAGLQCTVQSQPDEHSYAFKKITNSDLTFGDHVGLCLLLEKSPFPKTVPCVTRELKVNF